MPRLAVMIRRELPPAEVARFAAASEALGLDEVWVIEDCFYTSGVANAALALAATERAHVGNGILPGVLRNGALAAMEVATLAGAHPGRLTAGFWPGVASWMRQVGAYPPSPLAALEATIGDVRALLHGATVRNSGSTASRSSSRRTRWRRCSPRRAGRAGSRSPTAPPTG